VITILIAVYVAAVVVTFVVGMSIVRDSDMYQRDSIGPEFGAVAVVAAFMMAVCWPLLLAFFVGARVVKARGR
jgi:NADH:ubiquinone oxidoreductase subunit 6 (subunit J)